MFAESQPKLTIENVNPVVAFVGAEVGFGLVARRREYELVRLDSSDSLSERDDRGSVLALDWAEGDQRVPGRRRIDEVVEGDTVRAG